MNAQCSTEAVSDVLANAGLLRGIEVRYPVRDLPYPVVAVVCEPMFPFGLQEKVAVALRSAGHKVARGEEFGEEFLFAYDDADVLDMMRALGVQISDT
jgi:hypothetical protein